ncbi:hypothetical protein BJX99DRAFT_263445 [Aspergillus californicus]
MGEPFAVVSGAAGVLSLGLTVCQGLVAYYGPFTAFSSETESFVTRVTGLSAILEVLQSRLSSLQNPPTPHVQNELQLVEDRIAESGAAARGLAQALKKCQGYDATGSLSKKGRAFAKSLYPFRRGTVVALTDIVAGFQSNLEIALQVLNLAISGQIQAQNTLSLAACNSVALNTTGLPTSLRVISNGQRRLEDGQQQILDLVLNIQRMQLASIDQADALDPTQCASPSQSNTEPLFHRHMLSKRPILDGSQGSAHSGSTVSKCTCGGSGRGLFRILGALSRIRYHKFGCPMYFQKEVTTIINNKVSVLNRFIGYTISFSVTLIQETGTFTMNPSMSVRHVVNEYHAPAFRLFRGIQHDTDVEDLSMKLRCLFENGEASPNDILPDGTTLLHFATERIQSLILNSNKILPSYCRLLESLVVLYRMPASDQASGQTVFDLLLSLFLVPTCDFVDQSIPALTGFSQSLIEHNAVVNRTSLIDPRFRRPMLYWITSAPIMAIPHLFLPKAIQMCGRESFSFSDIELAVLQRSEDDLRAALRQFNVEEDLWSEEDLWIEEDLWREGEARQLFSASICAVEWPHGLRLILTCCPPQFLPSLLCEATRGRQWESFQIILDDGRCPVQLSAIFYAAQFSYNPAMFEKLVGVVAAHRRRLLKQALESLPAEQIEELGLERLHGLLDSQTQRVLDYLKACDDCDLSTLDIRCCDDESYTSYYRGRSVYHMIGYNRHAAEILYNAGFTNVDERYDNYQAPLAALWRYGMISGDRARLHVYLEAGEWYIDKGASIDYARNSSPWLLVHEIAWEIGECLSEFFQTTVNRCYETGIARRSIDTNYWRSVCVINSKLLQCILTNTQHHDCCVCACSTGGCLPPAVLFTTYFRLTTLSVMDLLSIYPWPNLFNLWMFSSPAIEKQVYDTLSPVAIRTWTFSALGLTHTCQKHRGYADHRLKYIAPQDIDEIREEERILIAQLEELISEFQSKYEELHLPLPEFMDGYWKDRMREVLLERSFDEEEAQSMRAIGVVVDIPY